MNCYILVDRQPVRATIAEWGRFLQNRERVVDLTELPGRVVISTVFLGIDHGLGPGPPRLFETMIFNGPYDGWQERCPTWDEAVALHRQACAVARLGLVERQI
jgi:hypothetical protein